MSGLQIWGMSVIFLALSGAAAHGVTYNDLGNLTLCLDSSTVGVNIESADPVLDTLYEGVVAERLGQGLTATLTQYRVPFEVRESCEGKAGFVYTFFYAHWRYPAGEEPSLVYAAALQVGKFAEVAAELEFSLTDERFSAYTAAHLFESDLSEPFHRLLPTENEQMMTELAAAWWDDRSYQEEVERARQRTLLVRLSITSGVLTMGILLVGAYLSRRRHKRQA